MTPTRKWLANETLLIFAIAATVRIVVALLHAFQGLSGVPSLGLSTWGDFDASYVQWLGFVKQGLLPYRDFYAYKYTPLFLYALYPFYSAAGAAAASIPIVAADAGTAVIVYFLVKRVAGTRIGFAAGLVYALSPFILYYEDFLWLSSQPMTFFLILAVYLFSANRPMWSFASLAIAVMFKQEALFVLPALLLLYARESGRGAVKGFGLFSAVVVVISLPFLILAPVDYVNSLNYYQSVNILNFGTPEPSLVTSAGAAGSIASVGNYTQQPCGVTAIRHLYTGSICGSIVNVQEFASSLLVGRLNQIAFFLGPILLVLLAPALYVSRRSPNFLQILCVYSLLGLLIPFSIVVEAGLAYYFVPVYALIFASAVDLRTLLLGISTALLSLTIPEGPFQFILPLGYLFVLIIIQDLSRMKGDSTTYSGLT